MPQDLTGAMMSQPLGNTGITLKPFVANGFDDDFDINRQPSLGLMTTYEPTDNVRLAMTHYYGPDQPNQVSEKRYITVAEAHWQVAEPWSVAAEYLYGTEQTSSGHRHWQGVAAITNLDLTSRWRLFGRWSYLNNPEGFVEVPAGERHEGGLGAAFYLHPEIECRVEYRHDFVKNASDFDQVLTHVTFGF
jgi:hypothetical protein